MEVKLLNRIDSIHDGLNKSDEIIKKITPDAFLSSVLLDFNGNISIDAIKYLYFEILHGNRGCNSYIIGIDNIKMEAAFLGEGYYPQKQIDELSRFDPGSFPVKKLDIERVKVDTEQLIKIALDDPPHFIPSAAKQVTYIDASLFVKDENIYWRFLCEHSNAGFRTLHINAESGKIVLYKLDKLTH
jgi:hypothetical protein